MHRVLLVLEFTPCLVCSTSDFYSCFFFYPGWTDCLETNGGFWIDGQRRVVRLSESVETEFWLATTPRTAIPVRFHDACILQTTSFQLFFFQFTTLPMLADRLARSHFLQCIVRFGSVSTTINLVLMCSAFDYCPATPSDGERKPKWS